MSNFLISFLFALGGGTWVYNKMYSRTGGNQQNSIIIGLLTGLLMFLFMMVVTSITGNWISNSF